MIFGFYQDKRLSGLIYFLLDRKGFYALKIKIRLHI